jgi:hypothetical protein
VMYRTIQTLIALLPCDEALLLRFNLSNLPPPLMRFTEGVELDRYNQNPHWDFRHDY